MPIERIRVGDKVWSLNRTTGKQELKTVTALTAQHRNRLIELRIEGEAEPLRPSLDHPFWVRRASAGHEAWIEGGTMLVGDLVLDRGGNWRKVLAVKPLEGLQTVYNFEVDGDHDYYVGKSGVLVHNDLCAWVKDGALKIRNKFAAGSAEDTAFRDFVDRWNQQVQDAGSMARQAVTAEMRAAANDAIAAERAANPGLYPPGTSAGHVPDVGWGGNPNGPFAPIPTSVNSYIGGATQAVSPGTTYTSVGIQ